MTATAIPALAPPLRPVDKDEAEIVPVEVRGDVAVFVTLLELELSLDVIEAADVAVDGAELEVAVPVIELEELAAFRSA